VKESVGATDKGAGHSEAGEKVGSATSLVFAAET
jgi:hypothetical protein